MIIVVKATKNLLIVFLIVILSRFAEFHPILDLAIGAATVFRNRSRVLGSFFNTTTPFASSRAVFH
jgi:hypothetical protein